MLNQLVKQVAPTVDPSKLSVTRDISMWYRIINGILYVPSFDTMKKNVLELSKFVKVLKVFALEGGEHRNNWENLNLSVIYKAEDIKTLHQQCREASIVATDIESRNVGWDDNKMLAIGFATDSNTAIAIDWIRMMRRPGALDALKELLADNNIKFIWHNGKFDCTRLKYVANVDAKVDEDTMLQHYACINEKRGTHGLKDLGPLYLQAPQWDDELQSIRKEYCRKNKLLLKDFTFDKIPIEVLIPYMQRDCIATYRLHFLFKKLANQGTEWIYYKLIEASPILGDMEIAGLLVDMERVYEVEVEINEKLDEAQQLFDDLIVEKWNPLLYVKESGAKSMPKTFNMKSPKQLKWLLEKVVDKKLKSTDASTIEELKGTNPESTKILDALRAIRLYSKQLDTYVNGLVERLNTDGRVRATFNLHGTETGRLSSSNPNMQNIPREGPIKSLFVAPEGRTYLQLDYSQAELRVLAHLSNDEFMTDLYINDRDMHSEVALAVFGPDFRKEDRRTCKEIIFGTAYGSGPGGVADTISKFSDKTVTISEAKALIDRVFKYMPQAKGWIQERRNMATRGDDCISLFGRYRHFVLTDQSALNHTQNAYINTPIQSVASDLTLFAFMEIHYEIQRRNLQHLARIVLTVHDSIMLEVCPSVLDEVAEMSISIMETLPSKMLEGCKVPFKADAEYGPRWGSFEPWEKEKGKGGN